MPLTNPLAWIDLEMTGLEPDTDVIVEIAVIVTDGQLAESVEGPDVVIAAPPEPLAAMAPIVFDMHTKSGLLDRIAASTVSVGEAEDEVLSFLRHHVEESQDLLLAGNSVHTDRAFIKRHMPRLDALLHYRHIDVSTLKELARRWYPEAYASAPPKDGDHRALSDIRESIEELRHYRRTLFGASAQEPQ